MVTNGGELRRGIMDGWSDSCTNCNVLELIRLVITVMMARLLG